MKKPQKIIMMLLAVLLAIGASAVTASAKAIGDDYTVYGYNAGWIFLIIGGALVLVFATKIVKMPKSVGLKIPAAIVAGLFVIGGVMIGVTVAPSANVISENGMPDMQFQIEGSVPTGHYPDTRYDKASGIFTIPYRANTTSDLIKYDSTNATYVLDPYINFTIKPEFPDTADDDSLSVIYFAVTNPTLYTGSDSDNLVLTKTSNEYQAIWTDQDGATSTVSGWTGGHITDTLTLALHLDLYQTGLAQADEYSTVVLSINFHNKANTWSESFQVALTCTESWIGK